MRCASDGKSDWNHIQGVISRSTVGKITRNEYPKLSTILADEFARFGGKYSPERSTPPTNPARPEIRRGIYSMTPYEILYCRRFPGSELKSESPEEVTAQHPRI